MRAMISLTAALAVCAYSSLAQAQSTSSDSMQASPPAAAPAAAPPAATPPADTPPAAMPAPAAAPAAFQLKSTTWTFTDKDGKKIQESIDAKGNFIAHSADGKEIDHGTSVMKGDKACFTSAVDKQGEVCWTTKATEVGQTLDTVSDKGEKLTVTRVDYVEMGKPK